MTTTNLSDLRPSIDPFEVGDACRDAAYPSQLIFAALSNPATGGQLAKRLADVCGVLMDEVKARDEVISRDRIGRRGRRLDSDPPCIVNS